MVFGQADTLSADLLSLDSLLNMPISSVSKYEQTSAEAPASVTIISHEEIANYGYNDLSELLTTVRDLYISDDRNYAYVGIRGFGRPTDYNNRVGIMLNGVALNENIWGSAPIGREFQGLNLNDVDRVEIIRGPASALYGTYPMLGMINIITHSGKSQNGVQAAAESGSYGKWQGSIGAGKLWQNGLHARVGARLGQMAGQKLYFPEYDDSTTNNGIADHRDATRFCGVDGKMGYRSFTLKWLYSWCTIHVPTGSFGTIFNDPAAQTTDRNAFVDLSYSHDLSAKISVQARTWLSHYHYRGLSPYDSAGGGLYDENSNGLWSGLEARMRWDILPNNRLLVGSEVLQHFKAYYRMSAASGTLFDQNFPYHTYSLYLQDEYQPFKKLSITLGGRYDRLYLGRNALTPRLAANFFAGKRTTIKALYGQAFRAPSIYEVNLGYSGFILPNPNLLPERIKTLELLCEQRIAEHFFAVASVYSTRLNHLIDQVVAADTALQYQNVQRAGGYGTSAEFNGRWPSGLNFYANYGFVVMRNLQDDLWLTNSPQHLFKAGISLPVLHHFRISPEVWGQSARRTVYDTETPPFAICNINFVIAPKFREHGMVWNRFQLAFKVRNVLNKAYSYPGGFEHVQASIPQNGRNFNLKLQVNLF